MAIDAAMQLLHTGGMERTKDATAQFIIERYESWRQARYELETKWQGYYRTYRCYETAEDRTRDSERSQIKMPATREAINMFVDSFMGIVFGTDPWFDLQPRSASAAEKASLFRGYLDYLFAQEDLYAKIEQFATNLGLYGTSVFQIRPKVKVNKTFARTQTDKGISQTTITESKRIHPEVVPVPIEDFYTDPNASSVQDGEGCMTRNLVWPHVLRQMAANGEVDGAAVSRLLAPKSSTEDVLPSGDAELSDGQTQRLTQAGIQPQTATGKVELLDWWGWIPEYALPPGFARNYPDAVRDGGAEVHVIVGGAEEVLKAVPNPYPTEERPFLVDCFEHLPGEFYGLGIAEVAAGPQRALDATVRSRIDNKALSINQLFAINHRKLVAGQSLKLYPGKAFLFDGPPGENFLPISVPDVTQGSYMESQEFERQVQSATGISRIIGGMPTKSGNQTAHEVQTLLNQSSGRITRIVESFERRVLKPLMRWYYQILYLTFDREEAFRITNSQTGQTAIISIVPSDIVGDYDFIPQGSLAISKLNRVNKYMQLLAQTANPLDAQLINRPYVISQVVEGLGMRDREQVLNPPPQQLMAAQQMGTQGSQPSPQPGGAPPTMGPPTAPGSDVSGGSIS